MIHPAITTILALAAAAFLSSLYIALLTVARAAVEELAAARAHAANRVLTRVLDDLVGHARPVGLLMLAATLAFVVGDVWWVAKAADHDFPFASDIALGLALSTLVGWVFIVALPTAVANHAAPRLVYLFATPLRALAAALAPLLLAGRFLDEVVRRLVGVEKKAAQEVATDEILSVVEESRATGAIGEQEREMIEAVVAFRDLTVQQIMTPRTDIEAMELTNDLGAVTRIIKDLGHSRIPVYEESLDHIVGIFYVKDLMHWLAGDGVRGPGKAFDLKAILRPALFVPETKTVRELLRDLMDKKVHIALVADEYGGTSGLVTIEDIVEEVFGDIKDEYEAPAAELPDVVLKIEQKKADIDAAARIGDVNDAIEPLGVQIPESEDYDTVGGFVITTLGRIPAKGEKFNHAWSGGQMMVTILEAKPTRVVKVSLEPKPEELAAERAPGVSEGSETTGAAG